MWPVRAILMGDPNCKICGTGKSWKTTFGVLYIPYVQVNK